MRVPVTDAFDDSDQLESLQVKLTPDQIEWLRQTADERDLSLDHVLRTILTAQMRNEEDAPAPPPGSGDSIPHSPDEQPTPSKADANQATDDTSPGEDKSSRDNGSPSIVESLRSASERLQDLTEEEEEDANETDLHDTLDRLRAHVDSTNDENDSADHTPETVLMDDTPSRSMFDMMEE